MKAGMGLTEALAYWNAMMQQPDVPPQHWWDDLAVKRRATAQ